MCLVLPLAILYYDLVNVSVFHVRIKHPHSGDDCIDDSVQRRIVMIVNLTHTYSTHTYTG